MIQTKAWRGCGCVGRLRQADETIAISRNAGCKMRRQGVDRSRQGAGPQVPGRVLYLRVHGVMGTGNSLVRKEGRWSNAVEAQENPVAYCRLLGWCCTARRQPQTTDTRTRTHPADQQHQHLAPSVVSHSKATSPAPASQRADSRFER